MPWIIGGAILGGSIYSAERAKDASDEQMAFQASQSAGAVQTRTADLRAAGINPILAAGQAATAMPGAQPQRFADPASAVQGFQEAKINKETVKLLREQQTATRDAAFKSRQEGGVAAAVNRGVAIENRMKYDRYESGTFGEQLKAEKAEARRGATAAGIERQLDESSGELFRTLQRLGVTGGTAAQILRGIRR